MSKVLDDYRDSNAACLFPLDEKTEQWEDEIIASRGTYSTGFDAAIDLLPVLFTEFIKDEDIGCVGDNWRFAKKWWTSSELYTYWKENILKASDLQPK